MANHLNVSAAAEPRAGVGINSRQTSSANKDQGFVLIAVLGMIMLLTLIASFVAGYAEQRLSQTQALRDRWQQEFSEQASLATVQFMLATTERTFGGWQVSPESIMRVDNRPYFGVQQTVFALQDEGSLLSVLDPDRDRWQRFLYNQGLSASQAEQFLDQLQDYTDRDDLRRMNGATSLDYHQAQLEPPPQRLMISPGQLFNMLNAEQWQAMLYKILPMVTTRSGQLTNLSTAPEEVLVTLPGTDSNLWQQLIAEREDAPFTSFSDTNQRLGQILPLDEMTIPSIPTNFVRVKLWPSQDDCRQIQWIGLTLTPTSTQAPWEIDYVFNYQHAEPCRAPAALAAAPLAR